MSINRSFLADKIQTDIGSYSPVQWVGKHHIFKFAPYRLELLNLKTNKKVYRYFFKEEKLHTQINAVVKSTDNFVVLTNTKNWHLDPNEKYNSRLIMVNQLCATRDLVGGNFKDEIDDFLLYGVINPDTQSGLRLLYDDYAKDIRETLIGFCQRELSEYKSERINTYSFTPTEGKLPIPYSGSNIQTLTNMHYRHTQGLFQPSVWDFKISKGKRVLLNLQEIAATITDLTTHEQNCFAAERAGSNIVANLDTKQLYLMAIYAATSLSSVENGDKVLKSKEVPEKTIKIIFEEEYHRRWADRDKTILNNMKDKLEEARSRYEAEKAEMQSRKTA